MLLHSHIEYFNLITATMAVTARASKTPLVLERVGTIRSEAGGFTGPMDMSIYNALTGEVDNELSNARDAIQQSEFAAQSKLLELTNIQDSVMEGLRRSKINPDDPMFAGNMARTILPSDTKVANVQYPALPAQVDVAYTRHTDTVHNIIGIVSTRRAASTDRTTASLDQAGLTQNARVAYQHNMNRFLRYMHTRWVAASGGDSAEHTDTFALSAPMLKMQDITGLVQMGFVNKDDIHDFLEEALGCTLRPFEEVEGVGAGKEKTKGGDSSNEKKKKKKKEPKKGKKTPAKEEAAQEKEGEDVKDSGKAWSVGERKKADREEDAKKDDGSEGTEKGTPTKKKGGEKGETEEGGETEKKKDAETEKVAKKGEKASGKAKAEKAKHKKHKRGEESTDDTDESGSEREKKREKGAKKHQKKSKD